jgi:hypothetical protein
MRGDSRTHSDEDSEEIGGTNGVIRVSHTPAVIKSASNAGSVFRVIKSHFHF